MAQILVKAVAGNNIPELQSKIYQRGDPVGVFPDEHTWGKEEGLPLFIIVKIPGISVDKVQKYVDEWLIPNPDHNPDDGSDKELMQQKRIWRILVDTVPAAIKNKLKTGVLTIKAGTYTGAYDVTWTQVKTYFKDLKNY